MSTDDVLQPPTGPALDEYGVPVEPRPGNRLVAYGYLAGLTVLPIATAFATVRFVPSHQGNKVFLGTWLMHSSPGHLIVGSGWPRLVALAGALIFLLSFIAPFLHRKQRQTRLPAKLTTKFLLMLPVVFLGSLLFMSGFFAGITLLVALILPHGMPVAPCNTCGGG